MQNKTEILTPESTYHVYNRANGSEMLFLSEENYRYFLMKYQQYIAPIADTFCYCLMPNHFHFLLRIKPEKELIMYFQARQNHQGFQNLDGLSKGLSNQFSNLQNAYSKAFNKMYCRKGSLFMHPFKRKRINGSEHLKQLILYIHNNPIKAGLCKAASDWKYSSYATILSGETTFLKREDTITWFENAWNFKHIHVKHSA
jgi:putative transposase